MSRIRPYGDTRDDGIVQLSFTLPMPWSPRADEAARRMVAQMGFHDIVMAEGRAISSEYSIFVVYARTSACLETDTLPEQAANDGVLSMEEVAQKSEQRFGRHIRIAGACIGTDAHTVGIDAILNMKGYQGDPGLERYTAFDVFNLGSQVSADTFVRFVIAEKIDVLLASQVVTQKGSDVAAFTALVERLEAEGIRERVLLLCGGPRMTALLAVELGYDAGFGRGTLPSEVATFIATTKLRYGWDVI
jgi:beta-lysine 5,6-aminomutase beta subunit